MKNNFRLLNLEIDKDRIFGLDILRAFAILLVVTGHSFYFIPHALPTTALTLFPDGVAIFFVLSGYLIGGILIKTLENNEPTFNNLLIFWKRRWLRTLPVYFLLLCLLCLLNSLFYPGFDISKVGRYFIFLQNFNTAHPAFFIEVWSLSIEEWFYLLIPLMLFILIGFSKLKPKRAFLISIVFVVAGTIAFRYYRYLTIDVRSEEIWGSMFRGQVVTRMDSLMFGVAGAYIFYYYRSFWVKYRKPAFAAGIISMVITRILTSTYLHDSVFYYCNVSFILTSVTVLLLLPYLSQLRSAQGFIFRFITYTSLISYSMYLTHSSLVMFFIINKIGFLYSDQPVRIVIRYFLYWGTTYLVSILLYKYFEMPFMAMRHKIMISSNTPSSPSPRSREKASQR